MKNYVTVKSRDKSFQVSADRETFSEIVSADFVSIREPLLAIYHAIKHPETVGNLGATKLTIYERMEQLEGMIDQLVDDYIAKRQAHERNIFWLEHPERFEQCPDGWTFVNLPK